MDCSFRRKINDDVRRCILLKRRAISWAMDDFPVPAWPKRTRQRSEVGSFTQLIMKFRKAVRVPVRHPLSGVNREPAPYGISLIFASSSATLLRSMTLTVSVVRTDVQGLARHPLQLDSHPVKVTRNLADIGRNDSHVRRNDSHIVQNLECSYLCGNRTFIQERLVEFEKGGSEVLDFFVAFATGILQDSLP